MLPADLVRLRHMLDAANEALSFSSGHSGNDLHNNRMLALAIVKDIEIIGEAANQVTQETRRQISQLPWMEIVGMRNRLIHAYFDIDFDRVWDTVEIDLPPLIAALEKVLQEGTES